MMIVSMKVRAIRMGILCAWLVAGACAPALPDLSEFDEFRAIRVNMTRPPFGTSLSSCDIPDALSVFSASIRRQDTGAYSLDMTVFAGEFGAVDPEAGVCAENEQLWLTADREEGCAVLIELPQRLLTDAEVDQVLGVFRGVQMDRTALLGCVFDSFWDPPRKCIRTTFIWDDFALADHPCMMGPYAFGDSSSSEILLLLEQLMEEEQ